MHVDKYCFRAPYVAALLRRGLGLHDDAPYHVEAGNVAWTLGASPPLLFAFLTALSSREDRGAIDLFQFGCLQY